MPQRILFICTGNSVRSIMAEAIANELGKGALQAFSAGAAPYGVVNPLTIATLAAHGHKTDAFHSKPLSQFLDDDFDVVITVCDNARQSCPVWPRKTHVEHWDIEDPSEFTGSDEGRKAFFERIYADIRGRIEELLRH